MLSRALLFVPVFLAIYAQAQTEFDTYSWNTIPAQFSTDTITAVDGTAVLLERRITEVYTNKDQYFEELFILHRKVRVESHKAIDLQNKIYIPVYNVLDVVKIEARCISPQGKIVKLTKESIKEVKNLENQGNYRIFAVEGAEVGGQIEYYYILRRPFKPYNGIYVQDDFPKGDVAVIFSFPPKLKYEFKCYNGFPEFVLDTDNDKRSYYRAQAAFIPALKNEAYSYYKANLMRFEYTLAYNYYTSQLRLYSFTKASNRIYENLMQYEKNELSAVQNWIKKSRLTGDDPVTKVRAIENQIKSEISIAQNLKEDLDLADILKNKQADIRGIVRLFIAVFQNQDISFELVLTSDVKEQPFDPEFNGFNYLSDYLIYIPAVDGFIVPDDPDYRIGTIPGIYQGGFGLFMRPVGDETMSTLAYEVKKIPHVSHMANTDTTHLVINIDIGKAELNIKSHRVFYGDFARSLQSFWNFIDKERQDEVAGQFFNMGSGTSNIKAYTVSGNSPSDIGINPLAWDLDITAGSLVEPAGNDIIVKLGETIGRQEELYLDTIRKLPVRIDDMHHYHRRLVFNIPAGYQVVNPAEMNLHVEMMNNGKTSCIFTSEAQIVGNQLIVISKEYYSEPEYPVEKYSDFRNVINAAADFNKKSIILRKL